MTMEELFMKATRFQFGEGITLDRDATCYEDGEWGFHHEDLVLHRQFGWIHAAKAGLSGSHFHTALDASDFFEQSSHGTPPPKSKGA
jgi:hypothetical protein